MLPLRRKEGDWKQRGSAGGRGGEAPGTRERFRGKGLGLSGKTGCALKGDGGGTQGGGRLGSSARLEDGDWYPWELFLAWCRPRLGCPIRQGLGNAKGALTPSLVMETGLPISRTRE